MSHVFTWLMIAALAWGLAQLLPMSPELPGHLRQGVLLMNAAEQSP
jgi:hypothetical protein